MFSISDLTIYPSFLSKHLLKSLEIIQKPLQARATSVTGAVAKVLERTWDLYKNRPGRVVQSKAELGWPQQPSPVVVPSKLLQKLSWERGKQAYQLGRSLALRSHLSYAGFSKKSTCYTTLHRLDWLTDQQVREYPRGVRTVRTLWSQANLGVSLGSIISSYIYNLE